jgi:hypothetical protein
MSRIVGDRANPCAGFFDQAFILPTDIDGFRTCKDWVSEPETHAALGDKP